MSPCPLLALVLAPFCPTPPTSEWTCTGGFLLTHGAGEGCVAACAPCETHALPEA